ncbi:hypothetical protein V8F20_004988 [Naviculisporaceae sp. PSN 640]
MARFFILALGIIALSILSGVQAQGNSECAQWCAANFPSPGENCTSLAAQGTGPCYECGPANPAATTTICNGACVDTQTDVNNCGTCGNVCGSEQYCNAGVCAAIYPTCEVPFQCGGPVPPCTEPNGPPGTFCFCATGPSRPENLCLDIGPPSTTFCGALPACASDSDCSADSFCWSSCCGLTCVPLSWRCRFGPQPPPSRMFRVRDDVTYADDLLAYAMAVSPAFNATLAEAELGSE